MNANFWAGRKIILILLFEVIKKIEKIYCNSYNINGVMRFKLIFWSIVKMYWLLLLMKLYQIKKV